MKNNILEFVRLVSEVHKVGPIMEFGSRMPDNQPDSNLRPLFPGVDYTGADILPGRGVDLVDDITASNLRGFYETVIACEVLEHVKRFWLAVPTVSCIISPKGLFIMSVPSMVFPIHHLPDYWRFTPQGIQSMLDESFGQGHSFILFQGDFRIPHTIVAIASHSSETLSKVVDYVEPRLDRIPAVVEGDYIYVWEDADTYARQWTSERKIVDGMEHCIVPTPAAFGMSIV